ncbi:PDZ domain-containing protein [Thermoleophilia bacterium SCSIO 60948]|nr:PDZ domain-containing protein [Thermoleophilia bacterium SCSIO 60948]
MSSARALLAGLAALLLALGLIACGGGDEGGSTTTTVVESSDGDAPSGGQGSKPSAPSAPVSGSTSEVLDASGIYSEVSPGVVTILSIFGADQTEDIGGLGGGGGAGQGSGFVLDDEGYIATNAHVVTTGFESGPTADLEPAKQVYIQFQDRNQVPAEIIGFDPFGDVALLKVDPEGLDLQPLNLGSETDHEIGEPVIAIGSPFGQDGSLSTGILSANDRSIDSLTQFTIDGALQTDASINPGNSGGPLIDSEGTVIGINQQINTTSGGNEGVGFALPIDLAERSIEELREDGDVSYAYLGVSTQPLYPQLAEELGLDVDTGALVAEIVPGSPADEAGLETGGDPISFQGQRGIPSEADVITAVDGEEIVGESDLPAFISRLDPGTEVTLDVLRDGETEQVDVTLGDRTDAADAG